MLTPLVNLQSLKTRGNRLAARLPEEHPTRKCWEHGQATGFLNVDFLRTLDDLAQAVRQADIAACDERR